MRANNVEGGRERLKNKHTKEDFMRRKRSKGEYGTSYIRVRMYTSHSIKQMAGKGSEGKEHVLRNKGDRGVGQSESNREEIRITVVVWRTK